MKPVVLAHGYLGFDKFAELEYFRGVKAHLENRGITVFSSVVGPKDSVPQRAAALEVEIRQQFPSQQVHVIAHSMGGLDARFLLGGNGRAPAGVIASLTTVSTPHRGTFLAKIATGTALPAGLAGEARFKAATGAVLAAAGQAVEEFGNLFHDPSVVASPVSAYVRKLFALKDDAVKDLTPERCQELFPPGAPSSGVPCFSYAGVASPGHNLDPLLLLPNLILQSAEGDNDGMVGVASAQFGEFMERLPADHAGVIGWGFNDHLPWYGRMIDNIQAKVADG